MADAGELLTVVVGSAIRTSGRSPRAPPVREIAKIQQSGSRYFDLPGVAMLSLAPLAEALEASPGRGSRRSSSGPGALLDDRRFGGQLIETLDAYLQRWEPAERGRCCHAASTVRSGCGSSGSCLAALAGQQPAGYRTGCPAMYGSPAAAHRPAGVGGPGPEQPASLPGTSGAVLARGCRRGGPPVPGCPRRRRGFLPACWLVGKGRAAGVGGQGFRCGPFLDMTSSSSFCGGHTADSHRLRHGRGPPRSQGSDDLITAAALRADGGDDEHLWNLPFS